MRIAGLLLLVLGVAALLLPNYQDAMPFRIDLPSGDLRIIAGVLLLLGLASLYVGTRPRE